MRKKIIAGNWKMNKTPKEAVELANSLKASLASTGNDVVFCVPSISILPVLETLKGTDISVGAQNMHFEDAGAFTGELSASMLKDAGVKYVVLGHSERRQYFAETDELVNKKTLKAIEHGIVPIVCVGELLEQREQGITFDLVRMQVKIALQGVTPAQAKDVVIAYEPVWAIGTGRTATSAQAEEVCKDIRETVKEIYSAEVADAIRIQYGGSVSGQNAEELFGMPNIDGGLVGGASLKPEFEQIAK